MDEFQLRQSQATSQLDVTLAEIAASSREYHEVNRRESDTLSMQIHTLQREMEHLAMSLRDTVETLRRPRPS
jgi:hypothetical protein